MNKLVPILAVSFAASLTPVEAQNPIEATITHSGRIIELVDIAQLPDTKGGGSGGIANTNLLTHAGEEANRVYVNDMRGLIYLIEDDVLNMDPFLDLADNSDVRLATNNIWQGFTTFAFHPDYAKPETPGFGKVYTATDERPSGTPDMPSSRDAIAQHSVLAEWTVDANNPNRVDPTSRRELLRLAWPTLGHKMDQLAFNPNVQPGDPDYGMLYLALGDGGDTWGSNRTVDLDRNGQNTNNLFGTIARIDPLANNGRTGEYGIPADNPFVGEEGFQPETWAYGFRNPHRFSWDRIDLGGDGTMYISDIGQAQIEEVSIGQAGGNYGWSEREGTFVVNRNDQNDVRKATDSDNENKDFIDPVIEYDHDEGRAIVGGFVVHGPNILDEHYVFGDIRNGRVFATDINDLSMNDTLPMDRIDELLFLHDGETKTMMELVRETVPSAGRVDLRFGQGPDGELYVLSKQDGFVRRMNLALPVSNSGAIICNPQTMGDIDGDGQVGFADFLVLSENFGAVVDSHLLGDLDCDGEVGFADFLVLSEKFGNQTSGTSLVPEPSMGLMFFWLGLFALQVGRRLPRELD